MLVEEDPHWLDLMFDHLEAKAKALSGEEDDIDWDAAYGSEED